MLLRALGVVAFGMLVPLCTAEAQQAAKIYRIGYLAIAPRDVQVPFIDALERGLRERGYVIGRDVVIEYRFADGKIERLPELAAELIRLKVDVLVTGVNPNVRALQRATTTIPIVTATSLYPVEDGLVASLARPGGNVTGLTMDTGEEIAKRLQLLREIIPGLTRVATLSGAGMSYNPFFVKQLEAAARGLGLTVLPLEIRGGQDLSYAFAEIERARVGGLDGLRRAHYLGSSGQYHQLVREEAAARYLVWPVDHRRRGRPHVVRRRRVRSFSAGSRLRRSHPEGSETGGPPHRATHEIRAGGQSEDCQSPRVDDSPVARAAGRSRHQVMADLTRGELITGSNSSYRR
jgi:hypothetical protein